MSAEVPDRNRSEAHEESHDLEESEEGSLDLEGDAEEALVSGVEEGVAAFLLAERLGGLHAMDAFAEHAVEDAVAVAAFVEEGNESSPEPPASPPPAASPPICAATRSATPSVS